MNIRDLLPIFAFSFVLVSSPHLPAAEKEPITKKFVFALKKGMPPTPVTLVWENSSLRAIEIRAKIDGAVVQRIKVGESEIIGCDLEEGNLPPNWIGTLDYNKDGFQDLFVQSAQGSDARHAVLLYQAKTKRFVASKALAEVTGLQLSSAASSAEPKKGPREVEDSFGLVSKAPNEPARLSLTGPPLQKGDAFQVVSSADDQAVYDAEILGPAEPSGVEGTSSYKIDFITRFDSRIPEDQVFLGTAVFGAVNGVSKGKPVTVLLANSPAGKRLHFRNCTSTEGLHFTVWAGKPLNGKRLWHAYHALGYDVEANCTSNDYPQ